MGSASRQSKVSIQSTSPVNFNTRPAGLRSFTGDDCAVLVTIVFDQNPKAIFAYQQAALLGNGGAVRFYFVLTEANATKYKLRSAFITDFILFEQCSWIFYLADASNCIAVNERQFTLPPAENCAPAPPQSYPPAL
jgi:hypothetical protein